MPSRSKTNKGKAKGKRKRVQDHDHKIVWNKVKHGAPKRKGSIDWVERIVANKDDAEKGQSLVLIVNTNPTRLAKPRALRIPKGVAASWGRLLDEIRNKEEREKVEKQI